MATASMTTASVASLVDHHIIACGKSLYCIAKESGFAMPNFISMIRTGKAKLPLDKLPAIAKSLDMDARYLLETALKEYKPKLWHVISEVLLDGDIDAVDGRISISARSPTLLF